MKKYSILSILLLALIYPGYSQLTGIKTIPGDYPSVHTAIFALNTQGVGSGGVTFKISSGYMETFISLTSGLITATGTSSDPIVFMKNGGGANPVISGSISAPGAKDYVFCLSGTDYITFDGIDITDPNGAIEWGYAILKASATDGSQYVTIKNCSISMSRSNSASVGIYADNVSPGNPYSQFAVTSTSGTNSNLEIYGNHISNVYNGIRIQGYNDPNAPNSFYDRGNKIGVPAGNTIVDFGGDSFEQTGPQYGIYTIWQNHLRIENNSLSGSVWGGTTCYGILNSTANDANVNINGNTISLKYYGANTFYGISNHTGNQTNSNVINVTNNLVTGCQYPDAYNQNCYYIYNNSHAQTLTVSGNTVSNNIYGSDYSDATGFIYGIFLQGTSSKPGTIHVYNNSVSGNARKQVATAAGTTYYLNVGAENFAVNIHDNLINADTVSSNGVTYCLYALGSSVSKKIYNNTVSNIINANGQVYGIHAGAGWGESSIWNNKVYNLNANSPGGRVFGINPSGLVAPGNVFVYNNVVSELYAPEATGSGVLIFGIQIGGSNILKAGVYNNTVFLDGSSSGASFTTAAIYASVIGNSIDIRNNNAINLSVPGGLGFTAALLYSGNGFPNLALSSNNNNYYAGDFTGQNYIFYDGLNLIESLSDYKQLVWPRDSRSVSENTPFYNTITHPYNLHVSAETATQTESGGTAISSPAGIIADFDFQPRFPNPGYPDHPLYPAVAPDIGADEFAGVPKDLTPPVITYTALDNTASLTGRTLIATITDAHGVPTTGTGLPRVCWKKNFSGTWSYTTGQWINNSQYSFTFGNGVTLGDSIYYFIVAQDGWTTPNIGTFPMNNSGGFSANPPGCSVPPSPPFSYRIIGGICGTLTVGAGQDYPTLSAAVTDLNSKAMTCPVTLLLTDYIYNNETYPVIIKRIAGASAENTLTIKPAPGITPLFSGFYQGQPLQFYSMITLLGARHVIFDGSNSGGNDRSMTFQNLATGGFAAPVGLYDDGNGGTSDIVVKNCVLQAHEEFGWNAQGMVLYTTYGNTGFRNITIHNNLINSAKYGVILGGFNSSKSTNIRVTGNTIGSMTPGNYVMERGISVSNCDSVLIDGNEIIGPVLGNGNILLALMGIAVQNYSTNIKISNNIVHDWNHPAAGATGIYLDMDLTTTTEIINNLIYDIKGSGSNTNVNGNNPTGIFVWAGGNMNIFNNTIHLRGNCLSADNPAMSQCIGFAGNGSSNIITGINLRNNILVNSMQPVSGNPGSNSYAVTTTSPYCFTTIDNNDYFVNGVGPNIGYLNGNQPILEMWQAATGQDANSLNINPSFVSSSDFHPTAASLNNKGSYTAVHRDIAGALRTNPPDMGIFEFGADPVVTTGTASQTGSDHATLNGLIMAANEFVNTFFDYGTTAGYGNSAIANPGSVTGNYPTGISLSLSSLLPGTTYHFRARGVTLGGLTIYGEDATFTTTTSVPVNTTATGTITGDTCFNASQTITVGGDPDLFTVSATGNVTLIAGQNILMLPGTTVQPGGYLHGYISNEYCGTPDLPAVPAKPEYAGPEKAVPGSLFSVYPNPTSGLFTLEFPQDSFIGNANVEIFSMQGAPIFSGELSGALKYELSLSAQPLGIYLIRVTTGGTTESARIIRQ